MTDTVPATSASLVRDPRRALVAAAIVAGVLVVQLLISLAESLVYGSGGFLFSYTLPQLGLEVLPKAIGIFLVLWLWPAHSDDRLLIVLVKGLVAAAAGCALSIFVGFVYAVIVAGLRFADAGALPYAPFAGIVSSIVMLAPLVMLVVLAQRVIRRGARL